MSADECSSADETGGALLQESAYALLGVFGREQSREHALFEREGRREWCLDAVVDKAFGLAHGERGIISQRVRQLEQEALTQLARLPELSGMQDAA